YVVNANDTIIAMEAASGKLRWAQHRTPALGMEIAGDAGPLVPPDRVYVAFSDGHAVPHDPLDGSARWPPADLSPRPEQALREVPGRREDAGARSDFDRAGRVRGELRRRGLRARRADGDPYLGERPGHRRRQPRAVARAAPSTCRRRWSSGGGSQAAFGVVGHD